jgi:hypothetical protein
MNTYHKPNYHQLRSAVRGDDRYVYKRSFPWWLLFLVTAAFVWIGKILIVG